MAHNWNACNKIIGFISYMFYLGIFQGGIFKYEGNYILYILPVKQNMKQPFHRFQVLFVYLKLLAFCSVFGSTERCHMKLSTSLFTLFIHQKNKLAKNLQVNKSLALHFVFRETINKTYYNLL